MKIKKNDQILVTTGKDKGKKGKVLEVFPLQSRIVAENINLVKRHRRARRQNEKGQVVEIPRPLHVSNVRLICPKCGQAVRLGYRATEDGKHRICKKCRQEV